MMDGIFWGSGLHPVLGSREHANPLGIAEHRDVRVVCGETKIRLPICCTAGISQIRRQAGFDIAIDDITSDHDIKLVSATIKIRSSNPYIGA